MKLPKISLILICLFAVSQISFGQEKPKAELIYEINLVGGCESYSSSLDSLFAELLNNLDSFGYVIIRGNNDNTLQKIIYKEWAYNHLKFREFNEKLNSSDENRFTAVKGEDSSEFKVELWKVPRGGEKPFKFNKNFDYSLVLEKPMILFDRNFDVGGLCPPINHTKVLLDFLTNNPALNGNIVFYESSKNNFLKRKREFLKKSNGFSQNRFRFFQSSSGYEGSYEFWLVPKKKK